jgi:hypothetical protein
LRRSKSKYHFFIINSSTKQIASNFVQDYFLSIIATAVIIIKIAITIRVKCFRVKKLVTITIAIVMLASVIIEHRITRALFIIKHFIVECVEEGSCCLERCLLTFFLI